MKHRHLVWAGHVAAAAACMALALTGPASARHPGRHWQEAGVSAPGVFAPWRGAPTIRLPASRAAFMPYLERIGAQWFVAGPETGARLPDVPKSNDLPHDKFALAIEFYFPGQGGKDVEPAYDAFLNAQGQIVYIEQNFAYNAH
jgi:hypothetical protein